MGGSARPKIEHMYPPKYQVPPGLGILTYYLPYSRAFGVAVLGARCGHVRAAARACIASVEVGLYARVLASDVYLLSVLYDARTRT